MQARIQDRGTFQYISALKCARQKKQCFLEIVVKINRSISTDQLKLLLALHLLPIKQVVFL